MKIKWYWLAEQLGLVTDLTAQYNDGYTHYQVSAQAGEVFGWFFLSLFPLFFLAGLLLSRRLARRAPALERKLLRFGIAFLLFYGLLLGMGVAPYLQFYPQSAGFLDFTTVENILRGLSCFLLALSLFLGSRLGRFWSSHCEKRTETP